MANHIIALIQRNSAAEWTAEACRAGFEMKRFADPQVLFRPGGQTFGLVVLSDFGGGIWAAIEVAHKLRKTCPALPIILVAVESCEASAIAALKAGVSDYLKSPFSVEHFLSAISRLLGAPGSSATGTTGMRRLLYESAIMRSAVSYASKVALTRSTVLITGETGTGKELAAELIHSASARSGKPFVALNCAAIPDGLLESELFGRERGAYTGADTSYEGKLKLADGGTVLFDEIGDLTAYGQAKLLRVLESRQIQRLGSAAEIPLDIRVLAATNQDLSAMVERGSFRRDLYFRLNVTRLELPPLRARREDISSLLSHFAAAFERELGLRFPGFSARALRVLTEYDWPGNVRQLRNVVEEIFVRLTDHTVDVDDLPLEISGNIPRFVTENHDEKTKILSALSSTRWNKKRAAERLCWSRMTLYRKMALHQIAAAQQAPLKANSAAASL